MNYRIKWFIITTVMLSFVIATTVLAASNIGAEVGRQLGAAGNRAGLGVPTDPRIGAARIIKGALTFVGTIFVILTLYAGYTWMTAGGNDEKVEKAKKLLVNSVIGLIVVLSAYSITWFAVRLAWKQQVPRDLPAGIFVEPAPPGEPCDYGADCPGY